MTSRPAAPVSRRERPAKPALTGPGIVAAAVEIMRGEGLERVTMRRLAQELDTGPASLYVYFRNTAELHAAVLDELLSEVDLSPAEEPEPWRTRLVRILSSYIDVLYAHPALARTAVFAPPRGEHYLDLVEALLTVLREGGLAAERAAWALDALLQFATATAAEAATRREDPERNAQWNAFALVMRDADPQRYPQIAATHELFSGTPQSRLAWNFEVLLNGILTAPDPGSAKLP